MSREAEYRHFSSRGSTAAASGLGPGSPAVLRVEDVVEEPRVSGAAKSAAAPAPAAKPAEGAQLLEDFSSAEAVDLGSLGAARTGLPGEALASTALGTQRPSSLSICPVGQPVPQALPSWR